MWDRLTSALRRLTGKPPLPLSPEVFTRRCAEAYRKSGLPVKIEASLHLKIERPPEPVVECFLDNAYACHETNGVRADEVIARYLDALQGVLHPPEPSADRLVPVIKSADYFSEIEASMRANGQDVRSFEYMAEPICQGLQIVYVCDEPHGTRYLSPAEVTALTGEGSDLRGLATANLLRIVDEIEIRGDEGIYMVLCGGDYEASLILADCLWDDPRLDVAGNPVFAIPSRDMLLVTGTANSAGIDLLRRVAQDSWERSAYTISPELFLRTHAGIEPLDQPVLN